MVPAVGGRPLGRRWCRTAASPPRRAAKDHQSRASYPLPLPIRALIGIISPHKHWLSEQILQLGRGVDGCDNVGLLTVHIGTSHVLIEIHLPRQPTTGGDLRPRTNARPTHHHPGSNHAIGDRSHRESPPRDSPNKISIIIPILPNGC